MVVVVMNFIKLSVVWDLLHQLVQRSHQTHLHRLLLQHPPQLWQLLNVLGD